MRSEVENNYAHDTMQGILNKIIELKFSFQCMIWLRCWLPISTLTTSKIIDKMKMFFIKPVNTNFWNTSRQWQNGINIVHHVPHQECYVKFSFLWNWLTHLTNELEKNLNWCWWILRSFKQYLGSNVSYLLLQGVAYCTGRNLIKS